MTVVDCGEYSILRRLHEEIPWQKITIYAYLIDEAMTRWNFNFGKSGMKPMKQVAVNSADLEKTF